MTMEFDEITHEKFMDFLTEYTIPAGTDYETAKDIFKRGFLAGYNYGVPDYVNLQIIVLGDYYYIYSQEFKKYFYWKYRTRAKVNEAYDNIRKRVKEMSKIEIHEMLADDFLSDNLTVRLAYDE